MSESGAPGKRRSLFSQDWSGLAGTKRSGRGANIEKLISLVSPSEGASNKREASEEVEELEKRSVEKVASAPVVGEAAGVVAEKKDEAAASDAEAAAAAQKKKKRIVEAHWVSQFLKAVPFDLGKLGGASKAAVAKLDEYPTEMWECTIPDLYTGTGAHNDHFLINPDRPYHQNTIDHFAKSHAKVHTYMVDALARGERTDAAATACLQMFREQAKKSGGTQTKLTALVRSKAEKPTGAELLIRERKELALALWLLGTQTPLSRLSHKSWADAQRELGINLHSAKELRRVHYPLIFEAILRLRQEVFVTAGFIHTEFDFLTVFNKSILIVCGHTSVGYKLFSDILGIVEFSGFGGAEHVNQLVQETISRVAPNSVLLATNTVDGALRRASEELVGEDDTEWCICHQLALPIKKSLNLDRYPGSVIALDFAFMHHFGVFVRSKSDVTERLDMIRTRRLGAKSERRLLLDCLARWESEYRKIKRFVELQTDLNGLAKDELVAIELDLMKAKKLAPLDAFKPRFWARLEAMLPVITLLHQVSKSSQSASSVTISAIPYWLYQITNALVRVEDEPVAVSDWKETMLKLTNEQFGDMKGIASNMWAAAMLDPRFADLSLFGVTENVQEEVWDMITEEHIGFKTSRMRVAKKDESFELPDGQVTVAKGHLLTLQEEMPKLAKPFLVKLLAGEAKIGDIDPLEFWRKHAELGQRDDNYAQYTAIAATACMLLSAPGNTATSERGVGRLRRTATPYRSMLSENMLEQEVICSHFINGPMYNFNGVLAKVAQIQQELQKK